MSLALRHAPERFDLLLDTGGWVAVDAFLPALGISRAQLDAVVAGNDKQRFTVQHGTDGIERIRANQGHSVPIDLGLAAQPPLADSRPDKRRPPACCSPSRGEDCGAASCE
jgi:putative RNA 2'-phosphotransferase